MNTKLVNSAAGVILAALTQNRTAAGIALALDSAQMLLTPETVRELEELRARVAELEAGLPAMREALFKALDRVTELEAERHSTNEALDDAVQALRADAITERIAPVQALREPARDVTPQVRKLRALLAGQRTAIEDPNSLHHDYRLGRDLPETGGA